MKLTEEIIERVWERGRVVADADPSHWRQDACGAWINRKQFGNQRLEFGWRAEPMAPGAGDDAESLRPFHWRNSCDSSGRLHCAVKADRTKVPAGEYVSPPRNCDI